MYVYDVYHACILWVESFCPHYSFEQAEITQIGGGRWGDSGKVGVVSPTFKFEVYEVTHERGAGLGGRGW